MSRYSPKKWNSNERIRSTHNCYAYAFDDLNPNRSKFPQPGIKAGLSMPTGKDFTCPILNDRVKRDNPNIIVIPPDTKCPSGTRKISLVVDPYKDYHFYRQDNNGYWSHKPGARNATNLDESGRRIKDPRFADRNAEEEDLNYDHYCMTFCAKPNSRVL